MSRANDQISLHILDQSCLGLAAREGPLGQDTEDVTDIALPLSCHHQIHRWIMWIFMVRLAVAVYNSVQTVQCPVMTCVHNCTLRRLEESAAGQDQNTGEGRHYQ